MSVTNVIVHIIGRHATNNYIKAFLAVTLLASLLGLYTYTQTVTSAQTQYSVNHLVSSENKINVSSQHGEVQKFNESSDKVYMVHWYSPLGYLNHRPNAKSCDFSVCQYNNCHMTFDRNDATKSDAVLFDGALVPKQVPFKRPTGQIWIFAAHESPVNRGGKGSWTKHPWKAAFNWTMTYDATNTDIHLPYGADLLPVHAKDRRKRDFKAIAMGKTKGALQITSHCRTSSAREKYVQQLKAHYDVTVLGECGTPWECGKTHIHNDCFDILNKTYRFYLAFENSLCRQYFTEKTYENFNYDIILIIRGGITDEAKARFPEGTFISTDDFKTARDLGHYLNHLSESPDDYAAILQEKSNYYDPGYKHWYQMALCDICERLNDVDKYRKTIPDIKAWTYDNKPCRTPADI